MNELEILPGVRKALHKLHDANYLLIVVTNQPDVARGVARRKDVERMNNYLSEQLPLDDFKTCYHDDVDNCSCRKPLPGALIDAAKQYGIDLKASFMVGDRWRDVQAGRSAGCKTFFVDCRYDEKIPDVPDFIVTSLSEAVKIILGEF